MSDDDEPGGEGVAYIELDGNRTLEVRRHGVGLLSICMEVDPGEYPEYKTEPVLVDLGAFLVDLQLTAADCKRALDGFGDQGLDRPDDATEPRP